MSHAEMNERATGPAPAGAPSPAPDVARTAAAAVLPRHFFTRAAGAIRRWACAMAADPRRLIVLVLAATVFGVLAWIVSWRANGWYHLRAARAALGVDHCRAALEHLHASLRVWPEDAEVLFLTARAARRVGELDLAGYYLSQCESSPALKARVPLEQAMLRAMRGEVDAVAPYCVAELKNDHADSALIVEALVEGYMAVLRFPEAAGLLQSWLEKAPNHPQALFLKGRMELQSTNAQEALTHFRRVVDLDGDRDDARLFLAGLCLELGQAREALPHLELLRHRLPANIVIQARLGRCLVLLGRHEEAEAMLDAVLAQDPNMATALLERGKLALSGGQLDDAAELLQKACDRDRGNRVAFYQLWLCRTRQKKTAEARPLQERMNELDRDTTRLHQIASGELSRRPRDPALHTEVGEIFLRIGAVDPGVRWLTAALRIDPEHAPAHRALAKHYDATGRRRLAEEHRALAGDAGPATPR
jgi:tetratricopeptide (TPR) repeat protein